MKILAAAASLEHGSWQHSIKESFCFLRPCFSPPSTHQTRHGFLKALRSVSRQDTGRAVLGTRDERRPGAQAFGMGFPYKPRQRVISEQVFKAQGSQMGLQIVKDQYKVSDIPGPFQNMFRRAQSHGVFLQGLL